MKSACVSSRNGFLDACFILKIPTLSFRPWKEGWERMAANVSWRFEGSVLVGNVSMVEPGAEVWRDVAREERLEGLRARSATARFPWEGEARMRAMPAPFLEEGKVLVWKMVEVRGGGGGLLLLGRHRGGSRDLRVPLSWCRCVKEFYTDLECDERNFAT